MGTAQRLILFGNLAPLLAGALLAPSAWEAANLQTTSEGVFAASLLTLLPVFIVAAVGAAITLAGGILLLIENSKMPQRPGLAQKIWLLAASVLPLLFVAFFVMVFYKNAF